MKMSVLNRVICRIVPPVMGVDSTQVLSILVYHRVLNRSDYLRPGVPTVKEFSWQMELLAKNFSPLSLPDAIDRLRNGELPPRAVCVTFDDGYADNLELALPELQRWKVPATIYIATHYLNGGRMWNDSIIEFIRTYRKESLLLNSVSDQPLAMNSHKERLASAQKLISFAKYLDQESRHDFSEQLVQKSARESNSLPNHLMLSNRQVVELHNRGVTIGAHTVTHPILLEIPDETSRSEISEGRAQLEDIIQSPVAHFAYPNGIRGRDFSDRHEEMIKDLGFSSAVTTHRGASNKKIRLTAMPRFTPWDKEPHRFALRLALNMSRTNIPELGARL